MAESLSQTLKTNYSHKRYEMLKDMVNLSDTHQVISLLWFSLFRNELNL